MQPRFCRKCGAALKSGAKFCGTCGAPVQLPAPAPAPAPEQKPVVLKDPPPITPAPVDKKSRGLRGLGRTILAVFLCIFIFVFSAITVGLFDIRQAVTAESIAETLDSLLSYSRLESMPAAILFADAPDDQTVIDWAVEMIEGAYEDNHNPIEISPENVEAFLEESTFLDFLADELEDYLLDLARKTEASGITSDDVQQLLEENIDLINELTGEQMGGENIEYILQQLEDADLLEYTTVSAMQETSPAAYYSMRICLSYWVIGLFALLTLLLILALAKCNKWNVPMTCGDTGITLTVQGGILVLSTVFSMFLPDLWESIFRSAYLASVLIGLVLENSLICSAVVLVLGVSLILVKAFCRKK